MLTSIFRRKKFLKTVPISFPTTCLVWKRIEWFPILITKQIQCIEDIAMQLDIDILLFPNNRLTLFEINDKLNHCKFSKFKTAVTWEFISWAIRVRVQSSEGAGLRSSCRGEQGKQERVTRLLKPLTERAFSRSVEWCGDLVRVA